MRRGKDKWRELQDKINVVVEEWRREHPEATLTEIETMVDLKLADVRKEMVEDLALEGRTADLSALPREERPHCPQCGEPIVANGKQKRRLVTDHEQTIELERSKAYCPHCQVSFFPSG